MPTTSGYSSAARKAAAELKWLKDNPAFEQRPATVAEFLGPEYLGIEARVRKALRECLEDILGHEVQGDRMTAYSRAMLTGGIGIGKTTFASIVLPWMAHYVLCLKDPQGFFNLLPGSRIAFMQMSTSEDQAKEVVFGDVQARIQHSPWFQENAPWNPRFSTQIRFEKEIWILPGDSKETTFEGYNILGGILDEMDSHQVTKEKDYAEVGYDTIDNRITSRFGKRGCFIVIGQMKKATGFAAKKYKEFKKDPTAYVRRMTIWESFGWDNYLKSDGTRDSFWYDERRKEVIPTEVAEALTDKDREALIEVPEYYRPQFETNPQKALRDLAGIPPEVADPFITLVNKIDESQQRWALRYPGLGTRNNPIGTPALPDMRLEPWFRSPDNLPRVIHIDMAYSAEGDCLGLSMGHCPEVVERDGEMKPVIVFDLLYRWRAPAGGEIFLGDVRRFVYNLQSLGFRIKKATMDGFQSTDTRQQFTKKRIASEILSVDKQLLPYHDLREAIYEDRCEFPKYMVYYERGDTDLVDIAWRELTQLTDDGKMVDHPEGGSKDVADTMAGVTTTLMGDRRYRRNVVSLDTARSESAATGTEGGYGGLYDHPALGGFHGVSAPVPNISPTGGDLHRRR